jgi:hypothetical protein
MLHPMQTYGYMTDSELNLAEEVRQQYQITDVDMLTLIASIRDAAQSEHAQGFTPQSDMLRYVQTKYRLSKKHSKQLVQNLSTLCVFPHRAVVDAIGADGTYGMHPVHESIIFKALQEYHLLPPGRPAYTKPRGPSLRDALANVLQETNRKRPKAS